MPVVLLAAVATLCLAVVPPASASSGGMVVTTDTTLTEDHHGPISIAADSVELDCAGHAVIGPSLGGPGIEVVRRAHVTIRHCHVTGFQYGISMIEDTSSIVVGNAISDNLAVALFLAGSRGGTFSGNRISNNLYGIWVGHQSPAGRQSTENRIVGNTATHNHADGFVLQEASSNKLAGNQSAMNAGRGFRVAASGSQNLLVGNTAIGNESSGFALEPGSDGASLVENLAIGNVGAGFSIGSSRNCLVGNAAFWNGSYGFAVLNGAAENTLTLNVAAGNTTYDAVDLNPPGTNSWAHNRFGKASGV